jgi:hypothetical protein
MFNYIRLHELAEKNHQLCELAVEALEKNGHKFVKETLLKKDILTDKNK